MIKNGTKLLLAVICIATATIAAQSWHTPISSAETTVTGCRLCGKLTCRGTCQQTTTPTIIDCAPSETVSEVPCVECDMGCAPGRCRCVRVRPRRCRQCPSCEGICVVEEKEVKEKKTCFKVEETQKCIPAVRLPWQKCCQKPGKARTVKVLKKHSYECPKCEYNWSVYEPEVVEIPVQTVPYETTLEAPPITEPTPLPNQQN